MTSFRIDLPFSPSQGQERGPGPYRVVQGSAIDLQRFPVNQVIDRELVTGREPFPVNRVIDLGLAIGLELYPVSRATDLELVIGLESVIDLERFPNDQATGLELVIDLEQGRHSLSIYPPIGRPESDLPDTGPRVIDRPDTDLQDTDRPITAIFRITVVAIGGDIRITTGDGTTTPAIGGAGQRLAP